jgi:hypothetical protein
MLHTPIWPLFLIYFLILLSGRQAMATFIVVRQTPDEIVAAADSFRVMDYGNNTKIDVCKIHGAGGVFYARAGIGAFDRFDRDIFGEIIAEGLKKTGSLWNKTNDIANRLMPPLTKMLEQYRQQAPELLLKRYSGGHPMQVAIFGFENGISHVFMINIHPIKTATEPIRLTAETFGTKARHATFPLGVLTDLKDLDDQAYWQIGSIEGARQLVERQIKHRPDMVGGDIHILRINRAGARWELKIPSCPTIN